MEIKNCPFCGNRMEIIIDDDYEETRYLAECTICNLETTFFRGHSGEQNLIQYLNQRPIEDELRARVKELEEQLEAEKIKYELLEDTLREIYE